VVWFSGSIILVDLKDGGIEDDISSLLKAEAQAHQAIHGKLQPALHERLNTIRTFACHFERSEKSRFAQRDFSQNRSK